MNDRESKHGQGNLQKLELMQKGKQLSEQEKKQHMVDDMYFRTLAEIEAVLLQSGVELNPWLSRYILKQDASKGDRLLNIEANFIGLYGFLVPGKEGIFWKTEIPSKYKLPKCDGDWLANIKSCYKKLPEKDPVRQVVKFCVDSISKGEIKEFPEELSDCIVSSDIRNKVVKDMYKNDQYSVVQMGLNAHAIAKNVDKKLDEPGMKPSNGTPELGPLFTEERLPHTKLPSNWKPN